MRDRLRADKLGDARPHEDWQDDDQVQVKVVDDRHVEYNGVPCSLTKAHRDIFKLDYNAQPTPYWTYNGKSLKDIYEETYVVAGDE